ncbi:MAG: SDR family NAD(P)-dependent oxidoreductase [Candidatus Baltobacteraceae bacterium]
MSERNVIVITGAGSGIGKELALQAARKGYAVIAVTKHAPHLDDLVAEVVNDGGTCVPLALDITATDAPARIVSAAQQRFGRLDVIINNAGFATAGRLLDQTQAQIDEQWQVHFAAPLRIMRAAWEMLQRSKGQVFFTGSGLARVPSPYYGAYCAAKAAVRAGVTQLGREIRGSGVAVTYIDPGSVRTNFASVAGIATMGPSWVPAKPADVARVILRAIQTRPRRVNGVWWHTLFAMLGEWFPGMTDNSMKNAPPPPVAPAPVEAPTEAPQPSPLPQPEPQPEQSDFERALDPVSRRLERVKLPKAFLGELLRRGSDVHLSEAAMRWAGMPNKNERAALAEALDALAQNGFLEQTGEETWRVLRSPV